MDTAAVLRMPAPATAAIDARALSKLRWRCRRGLLENDLLLERFFARGVPVSEADARGLAMLMELADNDLLDLFLGRKKPQAHLDRPEVRQVIEAVRGGALRGVPTAPGEPSFSPAHFSRTTP